MKFDKKFVYVFGFSFFWAIYIIAVKTILKAGIHPLIIPLQAYLIGIVFLLPFNINQIKSINKLKTKQFLYLLLTGGLVAISVIIGNYGLKLSTSINYGFLIKSTIIFATLYGVVLFNDSWSKKKALLIMSFLSGAYLLTTQGRLIIPQTGDLLIIVSAFFIASSAAAQKPLLQRNVNPSFIAFTKAVISFLILLFLAPFISNTFYIPQGGIVLLIAGVSYGIYSFFLSKVLQVATLSYCTMMSMITPVLVLIMARVFLKENLTIFHVYGGALIILSGIITHKNKA